ncbi:MAG: cobyrinate a,c-diamide synthase, partial [Oscillospiraceae bacterium]|nr:cobyrinate a,c-diamide synthase [Oscillospiraceae bacterium]
FLYLHTKLRTESGTAYPMADVIPGEAFPAGRLTRFGYITMTAAEDQLLCAAEHEIRAHEFHYWDSTACGEGFAAVKPDGRSWHCAHVSRTMYAGFPHLYLYSDIPAAFRFAEAAAQYGEQHGTHQQNPAG